MEILEIVGVVNIVWRTALPTRPVAPVRTRCMVLSIRGELVGCVGVKLGGELK